MTKKEFYFSSSAEKKARTRSVEWLPEGEPKAVLHLCHGVLEAAHTNEELVTYFTEHGFIVIKHECQNQEDMQNCVQSAKAKYPDVPYLLVGISKGVQMVHSVVNKYPGEVEGVVLADAEQEPQITAQDIPVLNVTGITENRQEAFRHIYHWTEERLDEMLYRRATKHKADS